MIAVVRERDGRWTVEFISKVARSRVIVHRAIALTEAIRVVRGKLENDMMGIEASAQLRETHPNLSTDEAHAAAMALLNEMGEAVNALDLGLDEEIRQRRLARYAYSVPRKQSWVIQP